MIKVRASAHFSEKEVGSKNPIYCAAFENDNDGYTKYGFVIRHRTLVEEDFLESSCTVDSLPLALCELKDILRMKWRIDRNIITSRLKVKE